MSTSERVASALPGWGRWSATPVCASVGYYLETPDMDDGYDAVNAARVRDLAAGRPLGPVPDLPPTDRTRSHR